MRVGTVQKLWRYPVKSMRGETLQTSQVGSNGFVGDRGYALRDERAGEMRGAKYLTGLLHCAARYEEQPTETSIPPATVTLPDGKTMRTDDPHISATLSQLLGREVTLWPRQPKENLDHYRRAGFDPEGLRQIFVLEPDEPIPSLEGIPPEIFEYVSPLGTYFDAFPIHFLTTASLSALSSHYPEGQFVPERFRPNIVIATAEGTAGNVEHTWQGKIIRLGEVEFQVEIPTIRCVMTTLPQGELPKDPKILRTVVQQSGRHVGIYANVRRPGEIRVGDSVEVVS